MPAYATRGAFEAYVEGWSTGDPAALDRLLERASRDVDYLLGPRPALTTGTFAGFKVDPATLEAWQAAALSRATCAQAEYLFRVGDQDTAVGRAPSLIQGPDFQVSYGSGGATARLGPKVAVELAPLRRTFIPTGARARP